MDQPVRDAAAPLAVGEMHGEAGDDQPTAHRFGDVLESVGRRGRCIWAGSTVAPSEIALSSRGSEYPTVEISNIDTTGGIIWGSASAGGTGDSNGRTPGNRDRSVQALPSQKRSVFGRVVSGYHPLGAFTRSFPSHSSGLRARSPGRARPESSRSPPSRSICLSIDRAGYRGLGPKGPIHLGRKTQIASRQPWCQTIRPRRALGRSSRPGVPQPIQKESRRPLGGGILELSAEAHTPAMAIRRKIAKAIYFHA